MSAFNDLNGVPATANHHTLTDILKSEWGFNGFVVSDYTSVNELIAHGIARDGSRAAGKQSWLVWIWIWPEATLEISCPPW